MKKLALSVCLLCTSLLCFSQTTTWKYEQNRLGDHWFVSAGVGAQVYFGESDDLGSFSDRIKPAFDFSVGKWFAPAIGVRAQLSGFSVKGFSGGSGLYINGPADNGVYTQEWDYLSLHGDVLVNFSTLVAGYKEDRCYELIPFIGIGFASVLNEDNSNRSVAGAAGFINRFKISDSFELNLEAKGLLISQDFDGETGGCKLEGIGSVTVGMTYNFGL